MPIPHNGDTAKIYAFPTRAQLAARKFDQQAQAALDVVPGVNIQYGAGWYHDEAIKADTDTLKQH